jgi:hypothetical protein
MFKRKLEKISEKSAEVDCADFRHEIAQWIELQNANRGPYGLEINFGSINKDQVEVTVFVVDKNGKRMWSAGHEPQFMKSNSTLTLSAMQDAFNFKFY